GRLSRNTTVCGSGASIASTFSYQSLRGFTRNFASASGAPRTMSNVYFTSLDVNGLPSCHLTSRRSRKTRVRELSCHDHFSASFGGIVSGASCFFVGVGGARAEEQRRAGV